MLVFDLDGVLVESKTSMDDEVSVLLSRLLQKMDVCIITGGSITQINKQVLPFLENCFYNNLYLMPLSGSEMWIWRLNKWIRFYFNDFSEEEIKKITSVTEKILPKYDKLWGDQLENRGGQVTWSAYGQNAPLEVKKHYDPDGVKRKKYIKILQEKLPEFEIRIGGTSSIDITQKNIDKAYGIQKLLSYKKINVDDIVFVGDSLFEGGNDYPVKKIGVKCYQVNSVLETKKLINNILEQG